MDLSPGTSGRSSFFADETPVNPKKRGPDQCVPVIFLAMADSESYRFPPIKKPPWITSTVQLRPRHSRTSLVPGCNFAPTDARAGLPATMRSRSPIVRTFGPLSAAHCSSNDSALRRKGSERFFGGGAPIMSRQRSTKCALSAVCKLAKATAIFCRIFVSAVFFILLPPSGWWKLRGHQTLARSNRPCRTRHRRASPFQSDGPLCATR